MNPMRGPALCVVVILASFYAGTEAVPLPSEGGVGDAVQLNAESEGYEFNPNFDSESEVSDIGEHSAESQEESARAANTALQGAKALSQAGGNTNIVNVPTKKEVIEKEGFGKPVGALEKQAAAVSKQYAKQEVAASKMAEAAVGQRPAGFIHSSKAGKQMEKAVQFKEVKEKRSIKQVEDRDAIAEKDYEATRVSKVMQTDKKLLSQAQIGAKRETAEEKVAESDADAAVNPALVKRAEAEEQATAAVDPMAAQARAEKLAGVGVLHHMSVSAKEEASHAAMKEGKAEATALNVALSRLPNSNIGKVRAEPKVNPYSVIAPLDSEDLLQIPDGVVPDSLKKPAKKAKETQKAAPQKADDKKKAHVKKVAPKKAPVKKAAPNKAAQEEAKLDKEATAADKTSKSAHHFTAAEKAAEASASKESTIENGQAAQQNKGQAQDEAFAAAANAKAQAAQVKAVHEADPVHKAQVAAKETVKKEYSQAAQEAMKSATTAALLADQKQVTRDVAFLPDMSKKLHALKVELAAVQKRNKYAANVASAISKGINSVMTGKKLAPQVNEEEVLIQLGEGNMNNPFGKLNDGQVAVQAKMDATAYNQAVAYENDRTKAEETAEEQIRTGTMNLQQQQAAGVALQAAKAQDEQRITLMHEIAQVHQNYRNDLAEAQQQAKAKAMATLKNFANELKGQQAAGSHYNVNEAYSHAQAIAPQMAPQFQTSSLGEAKAAPVKKAPAAKKASAPKKTAPAKKPVAKAPVQQVPVAKKAPVTKKSPVVKKKPPVVKKAAVSQEKQMETKEAKMQAASIAQAGVERALVDTGKKINGIKKKMSNELNREKKYFQDKQKKAFVGDKKSVAKHMNGLKHMNDVADKNLNEETGRLQKQIEQKQVALGEMKKIRDAAKQEREGVENTSVHAHEMEKAAAAIKGDLKEQLRNYKRPVDRVDHVNDLGEVQTISGEQDLGESDDIQLTADVTMGSLSPATDLIEKKNEAQTDEDLNQIKVLEQTAANSANVFLHSAKVTEKESALADARQNKIIDEASKVMEKLKADIGEAKTQVDQAKALASKLSQKVKQVQHASKQADKEAQAPKGYELGESDRPDDLGESASSFGQAQPVGLSKLKAEQFALVNAQTKLNQLTKFRKSKEDVLAKKWGHLELTRDSQEQVKLQNEMGAYQASANKEIQQTTALDKFMVKEKSVAKKEQAAMKKMKQQEDAAVHDEFIATQDSAQAMSQFDKLGKVAAGLTTTIHNSALKKVVGSPQPKPANPAAAKAQKLKEDVTSFVAAHRTTVPKVNEAEIQPTKAKAQMAQSQEKKDEKLAAAYGKQMEHKIEAKMGKPADIRGDGAHHAPQIVDASQNPVH